MKLTEIGSGSKIIMHVGMNGQFMDFPTVIAQPQETCVIAEAIRVNGKVLGLQSDNIHVDLMLIREDKTPVIWKNVRCSMMTFDSRMHYKVTAFAEGYEVNRREAFRVFVGKDGVAQLGMNRKAENVIVKDVSENGFSFISSENLENSINSPVRLVFSDMELNFSLMGIVVRKVAVDDKKNLYGCKLSVDNHALSRYINDKQRQLLSSGSGRISDKTVEMFKESMESDRREALRKNSSGQKNSSKHRYLGISHGRDINDVDKKERRDVFKMRHMGKRV